MKLDKCKLRGPFASPLALTQAIKLFLADDTSRVCVSPSSVGTMPALAGSDEQLSLGIVATKLFPAHIDALFLFRAADELVIGEW